MQRYIAINIKIFSIVLFSILISLIFVESINVTYDCYSITNCTDTTITCSTGFDECIINCHEDYSCQNVTMIGTDAPMIVNCIGHYSCHLGTIRGGDSTLNISCREGNYACGQTNIYGGSGHLTANFGLKRWNYVFEKSFLYCPVTEGSDCTVYCYGNRYSCRWATIIGGNGNLRIYGDGFDRSLMLSYIRCPFQYDCLIEITGGAGVLIGATINASQSIGNLIINGWSPLLTQWLEWRSRSPVQVLSNVDIYCPSGYCNITCWYSTECMAFIEFYPSIGTQLNINASGNFSLSNAKIRCPLDTLPVNNEGNCNLYVDNSINSYFVLDSTVVFATESFYDINIETSNGANGAPLYEYGFPLMYCTPNLTADCLFHLNDNDNKWECIDSLQQCNTYFLPTLSPTEIPSNNPTTAIPTYSPTKYIPHNPPVTLFLNKHGCDYGICDEDLGNYTEYCSKPWFNDTFTEIYNECQCSEYMMENRTQINDYNDSSSICSVPIVIIDGKGTFTVSVIGNKKWTSYYTVCFSIVEGYQCEIESISAMFETIDYSEPTENLIIYYNESIAANDISRGGCNGGIVGGCDRFVTCPLNPTLVFDDSPWNNQQAIWMMKNIIRIN